MQNSFIGCYASRDMINTRITNPQRNVFGALIGIMLDYITFSCRIHSLVECRAFDIHNLSRFSRYLYNTSELLK